MFFYPSDERFYYYKSRNNRKFYYFVTGVSVAKNKIPQEILQNIKEYDKTLQYYETSKRYEYVIKSMKNIETLIKDVNKTLEEYISKHRSNTDFTYEQLSVRDPLHLVQ